jgi:hypothetical protein
MRNCGDPNSPDLEAAYADCTSLGQGIFDACDTENKGSPGDMIKFLELPDTCDLGGEAGASTTGSDAAAAAATPNATDIAKPTQPMSGAWASKSTLLWLLTVGVLVSSFTVSS